MPDRAFQINEPAAALRDSAKADAAPAAELPYRAPLGPVVDRQLATSRRNATPLAVIALSLDGVDSIRERYGPRVENQLLYAAWNRLKSHLRASDLSVRVGDAEFAAILPDAGAETVTMVETRILDALARPYGIDTLAIAVALRAGVAVYPHDGATGEALASAALAACAADRPWAR
jgi:diguanylate cyclase (GGDEF)-like protein